MTTATVVKTGNILAPGGLEIDMAQITSEQSKRAFARAAAEATSDEDRTILAYQYLTEMVQERIEPDKGEETEMAVAKKAQASAAKPRKKPVVESRLDMTDRIDQLAEQMQKLMSQILVEKTQAPVEAPPLPDDMISKERAVLAMSEAFDGLGIPGLGPVAEKPKHRITFDLGEAGKMSSFYHWVSEHDQGLFLVYDTRFEYGSVFEPPNLGKDRTIRVSHAATGREWLVYSLGFVHPLGIFNITNLVIAQDLTQERVSSRVDLEPVALETAYDWTRSSDR